jgi:hypothetical protein
MHDRLAHLEAVALNALGYTCDTPTCTQHWLYVSVTNLEAVALNALVAQQQRKQPLVQSSTHTTTLTLLLLLLL